MLRLQQVVPRSLSSILVLVALLLHRCDADVGIAGHYDPPYTLTACFGYNPSQFPLNLLFAAAGEEIWNNGVACRKQYWVRCISANRPKTCNPTQLIQVKVVDRLLSSISQSSFDRAKIVLSKTAFKAIANPSVASVNIKFIEV